MFPLIKWKLSSHYKLHAREYLLLIESWRFKILTNNTTAVLYLFGTSVLTSFICVFCCLQHCSFCVLFLCSLYSNIHSNVVQFLFYLILSKISMFIQIWDLFRWGWKIVYLAFSPISCRIQYIGLRNSESRIFFCFEQNTNKSPI